MAHDEDLEISNWEHDETYGVKKVSNFVSDGQGNLIRQKVGGNNLAIRITVDGYVTYVGQAVIGSASSASVWQIQKIDETTGTIITWADGDDNFDNVWDNYAVLTYS